MLWLGFFGVVGVLLVVHRRLANPAARFAIGLSFVAVIYPVYACA